MGGQLVWENDGLDWPHREASRFVVAGGLRWHVQQFQAAVVQAPVALLIHGTGASTHSWRGLAPLLAQPFHVVSMDLPGHAFTSPSLGAAVPSSLSLPDMARAVGNLLGVLKLTPDLIIGHSAGAAIAVRMCLDGYAAPRLVVSLNGAFLPWGGVAGQFFSPMAKLMVNVPFLPGFFSRRASDPAVLQRLIDGTGSTLDATGVALYRRLVGSPAHVAGALGMMANWDLHTLVHQLPGLKTSLGLVVGTKDRTIPPWQAKRVQGMVQPGLATLTSLDGLGHLAHEERPEMVAADILRLFSVGPD